MFAQSTLVTFSLTCTAMEYAIVNLDSIRSNSATNGERHDNLDALQLLQISISMPPCKNVACRPFTAAEHAR